MASVGEEKGAEGAATASVPISAGRGPSVEPGPDRDAGRILAAVDAILGQGEELLSGLDSMTYGRPVPLAFHASIGGHYRHCLDHFVSLLRGWGGTRVDYDDRKREEAWETRPQTALEVTRRLRRRLAMVPTAALGAAVEARCEVSYVPGVSPVTGSTLGREMVYAIAHAVHHYALIAVMAGLLGVRVPERFGVAPSTVAHRSKQEGR